MRILLLIDDYYPSTKSGAKMMHDLAVQFVRDGHESIVVTPSQAVSHKLSISVEEGVTVVRVRGGNLKYTSRAIRGLREFRLSANIWRRARAFFQENQCDIIVFYSPTIFFGPLVRKLKALWRCPAYLILRDIFPQWAVDAGVIKKGLLYRYLRRKELEQYGAADLIGAEGAGDLEYFRNDPRLRNCRVEVLFNCMDTQQSPVRGTKYREELGLLNKVVFFYGGNIGVAQGVDSILRLALNLRDHEKAFFLLVGSGTEVQRLQAEIAREDLRNVRILPPLPQDEYLRCLAEFDIGIVSLHRNLKTHNTTGKLLGYLLCGKPVLASLNPGNGLAQLLQEADAGIACENGDDDGLNAAALLLLGNPDLRKRMSANAKLLGETKFSARTATRQILSHILQVPDHHSSATFSPRADVSK